MKILMHMIDSEFTGRKSIRIDEILNPSDIRVNRFWAITLEF
jgi:hypothetical protein